MPTPAFTPLIDTKAIKANIASFIQAVVAQTAQGQLVTWAYDFQEAVKPPKPYAVYKITGPRKVGGLDEIRAVQATDNNGNLVFENNDDPVFNNYFNSGEREYTVSIECASNNEFAIELATNLMAALEQPQFVSILEQNGCSVRNIMAVQDVTIQIADSTKYERRSILEFYFVAPSVALYGIGKIQEAQGEINTTLPSGLETEISLDAKVGSG